jgi:hypothetical protein
VLVLRKSNFNAAAPHFLSNSNDGVISFRNPGANLSAFTEGKCCPSAVLDVFDKAATCKFMRSRSALVHNPGERPSEFGTTCLSCARDFTHFKRKASALLPHFSVLVNVFNSQAKLRIVLTQLIKLTTEPWESVVKEMELFIK